MCFTVPKNIRKNTMLFRLTVICLFILSNSVIIAGNNNKRPFSTKALENCIKRKDYKNFDFYVESYLRQHPDTAILYLLKGYRYFDEAKNICHKRVSYINNSTGGIPRKYPPQLMAIKSDAIYQIEKICNSPIIDTALNYMRYARDLEPDHSDIYMGICKMAAQVNRPELLSNEINVLKNKFGYIPEIRELIIDYFHIKYENSLDSSMISIMRNMIISHPDEMETFEISTKTFIDIDSTQNSISRALVLDSSNKKLLKKAIGVAMIRSDFSRARDLLMKRYNLYDDIRDIEQAAICAYAEDRVKGRMLYEKILLLPGYCDSTSLIEWIFNPSHRKKRAFTHLYSGDLFPLNIPVLYIEYRSNGDMIKYFHHKAGIFYLSGIYDSAAHYNLSLVRNIEYTDKYSYPACYNLAAEYYAIGKYRLSFIRFLRLNEFINSKDIDLHYALGLNYAQFKDYNNARKHYRYVIRHSRKNKNNLAELAAEQLDQISNKKDSITFTIEE